MAATTILGGSIGLSTTVGAQASSASSAASPQQYAWPKFADNPGDTGLSSDTGISAVNAGTLGVHWMTALGSPPVSSPVTAWNATLGETLVYIGTQSGDLMAFDAANGSEVWSVNMGSTIQATPLVEGGSIWVVRAYSTALFKLNAATGATQCSTQMDGVGQSTPTAGTPVGGTPSIYMTTGQISATTSGIAYGVNQANCDVEWKSQNFWNTTAGSWDPISFGTDATGQPLVLFGSNDPDDTVYALNGLTGAKVWSFTTPPLVGNTDTDVGAGITVSSPGTNGFADGVAYVPSEDGYVFALDLTTGAVIWSHQFGVGLPHKHLARSTAALFEKSLAFGTSGGVTSVNAVTGKPEWAFSTHGVDVLASPAVTGPRSKQVVAVTTLAGALDVLDAKTGALLYKYQTPGYVVSSFADVNGTLVTASTDDYLYDLAPGGGNGTAPSTAITSPESGATVPNPGGTLNINGTATGTTIAGVDVAVEAKPNGQFWDATAGTWVNGFFDNAATVSDPGAASTTWSFGLPVPPTLGTYQVLTSAMQTNGLADISDLSGSPGASNISFTVDNAAGTATASLTGSQWVAPGAKATVTGSGFGASETVTLTLERNEVGTATTTADGDLLSTSVTVPADSGFGPGDIVATGRTSGRTADAAIYVSNEWTQAGYDSSHSAMEPDDSRLLHFVAPGPPTFLTNAWTLMLTAPVRTSPAVVQDVAYVGDVSGTVTAIDVRSGEPLWSTVEPNAIDSAPAVSDSLVCFGTEGDAVVALDQADGSQVWSTPTSSEVESAPAVANGELFVGSHNGTVYALDQATGAVEWHHKVGGAVMGSPAVDASSGVVVVADSSGAITTLSASDGDVLWTVDTSGAITATPSIFNGVVYVGNAASEVYALLESTGDTVWTAAVPAPVTAGGAIYSQPSPIDYVVGSQDGTISYLNLRTGSLKNSAQADGAVVGVATSDGWVTVTTGSGQIDGLKHNAEIVWQTSVGAAFVAAPTTLNGVVYTAGTDDTVRAYTVPGSPIP
jgi:outer membrane protein assembly factor BamB